MLRGDELEVWLITSERVEVKVLMLPEDWDQLTGYAFIDVTNERRTISLEKFDTYMANLLKPRT
jgi:hypothetical protein